eukprot:g5416.t1
MRRQAAFAMVVASIATVLFVSAIAGEVSSYEESNPSLEVKNLFETFMVTFGRTYPSPEAERRAFDIFKHNMRRVVEYNEGNPHATFSIFTRWADLTRETFAQLHGLGGATPCQFPVAGGSVPSLRPTAAPLKGGLDYVAKGATTAVKNQGKCASCWAHATTAVVEGRLKLDTGKITSLSEQYLLDCDTSRVCKGCCGGLSENALQWLAGDSAAPDTGAGIASEADYPYVSAMGTDPVANTCNYSAPIVAKVTGFGVLQSPLDDSTVVSAATQYGVLSVAMDAHVLQFYTGGIITNSSSCSNTNHAVAIVGYGTSANLQYYKVRNSYGTSFGEQGYFRISQMAASDCGMYGCVIAATGAQIV